MDCVVYRTINDSYVIAYEREIWNMEKEVQYIQKSDQVYEE